MSVSKKDGPLMLHYLRTQHSRCYFKDYAEAHAKLSNLGAKFNPPEICRIIENYKENAMEMEELMYLFLPG